MATCSRYTSFNKHVYNKFSLKKITLYMYMYKKGTQFKMVVHTFFLGSARSLWSYFSFFNRSEEKKKIILCTSISLKLYMFLDIHCTYWYMYMYIYAYIMWLFHYFIYTHTFTCERNNFNKAFFKYKHSKCSIDKLKQKQFYKQVFSYLDIEISRYEIYFWHLTSTK